MLGAIKGGWCG